MRVEGNGGGENSSASVERLRERPGGRLAPAGAFTRRDSGHERQVQGPARQTSGTRAPKAALRREA